MVIFGIGNPFFINHRYDVSKMSGSYGAYNGGGNARLWYGPSGKLNISTGAINNSLIQRIIECLVLMVYVKYPLNKWNI